MTPPPPARVLERTAAPAATGKPASTRHPAPAFGWGWPPRGERVLAVAAVIRREWVACVFTVSAAFAAVTALISFNAPERVWGRFAAVTYAVAAVTAATVGRRAAAVTAGRCGATVMTGRRGVRLAVLLSLGGALAAPLAWMAVTGMAQPEVAVILRSAAMLVHRGTPYASPAALATAHAWRAYDPYLPALIVFGIPRVFGGGPLTDPRAWFGLAFAASFVAALRIARVPRPVWWTLLVMASPVVALPLAVGGDDLPVLGLICLGLALAGRGSRDQWHWAAAAGLALGLAAAMKATGWPAVAVVAVLLAARQGWRAVCWFTAALLGVVLVADGPVVAGHPAAALANTVLYPLGLTKVTSPAASMLPGHLLAGVAGWGHSTALALIALAGAGIGGWLIARPPVDFRAAGWRLALGLALLFLLAPASRVGYFVYPLGLAAFLSLTRWAGLPDDPSVDPVPQRRWLAGQVHH